jgi:hypothetical protein
LAALATQALRQTITCSRRAKVLFAVALAVGATASVVVYNISDVGARAAVKRPGPAAFRNSGLTKASSQEHSKPLNSFHVVDVKMADVVSLVQVSNLAGFQALLTSRLAGNDWVTKCSILDAVTGDTACVNCDDATAALNAYYNAHKDDPVETHDLRNMILAAAGTQCHMPTTTVAWGTPTLTETDTSMTTTATSITTSATSMTKTTYIRRRRHLPWRDEDLLK